MNKITSDRYIKYYIILVALILRIIKITNFSLSEFEYHLLNTKYKVLNPFIYNFLTSIWKHVLINIEGERILSLIFGVLSVVFIIPIGELIIDKKGGYLAGLFLAVSPLHIIESQTANFFSLYIFLHILSLYFLTSIFSGRNRFFPFIVVNLIGLSIHPFFFIFFISQLLSLVLFNIQKIKSNFRKIEAKKIFSHRGINYILMFLLIPLFPPLWIFLTKYQKLQIFSPYKLLGTGIPIPNIFSNFIRLIQTYLWIFLNFSNYYQGNFYTISSNFYILLSLISYQVIFLKGLKEKSNRRNFLVINLLFPLIVISIFMGDLKLLLHYALPFAPIFYLLLVIGYENEKSHKLKLIFIFVFLFSILFVTPNIYNNKLREEINWKEIINLIEKNIQPQDGILILNKDYFICTNHYIKKEYRKDLIEGLSNNSLKLIKYKRVWILSFADEAKMNLEEYNLYNSIGVSKILIWEKDFEGKIKLSLYKQ